MRADVLKQIFQKYRVKSVALPDKQRQETEEKKRFFQALLYEVKIKRYKKLRLQKAKKRAKKTILERVPQAVKVLKKVSAWR